MLKSFVDDIESKSKRSLTVNFSEQDETSDSFVFLENGNLVLDSLNKPITRPAGHGALLANLQTISSDLIFVKNIDNVQHLSRSEKSNEIWQQLGGLSLHIKSEIEKLILNPTKDSLKLFNNRFYLYSESEINSMSSEDLMLKLLNRPLRVCGMVRNEGQIGGGPFFVSKNGLIQKQIIEKSQIDLSGDQASIFFDSTHFNPVMMVLDIKDQNGINYDLANFKDDEQYLAVSKNQAGVKVCFMELPGLWNGSMANWNTLFVEIPNEVFTPVKSVLDLINPAHVPKAD